MKSLWFTADSILQGHVSLGEFNLLWAFQADDADSLETLPLIGAVYREFAPEGLHVIGLATALEQFGPEDASWAKSLLENPEIAPEFPIVLDSLHVAGQDLPESYISFLCNSIPDFRHWPLAEQEALRLKARRYLVSKPDWAVTMTLNEFARLPVWILFNRYYEVLEEWSGSPDPEELYARVSYWLSHQKKHDIRVDPY